MGVAFNHCFFLLFSEQVALCQLTHLTPALTVTNDKGAADFIYLSIGKIKEEEIKKRKSSFFLGMLEDWHFYRRGKKKDKGGVGELTCLRTCSVS